MIYFVYLRLYNLTKNPMSKKRFLIACMFMAVSFPIHAQSFETATEAVKNMGVGWNLGNTLDACSDSRQGVESENYWGQPYTKPELMKMMKEAGFGAIRVPVTWMNHMDSSNKVDAEWMKRVHEVVDYVIDQGLYCIVNVHHDTGDGNTHWLHASTNTYNNVKARYESLWQQIAEEFKDYGEKLLFESYNEMLDEHNSWCFASFAASGNYNAVDAADAYAAINNYAQSFVDVVRATGGNNTKRNLIVNTYGACSGSGTWNTHLKDPLKEMKYPTDNAGNGHIIFEVHSYPSIVNTKDGVITGNRPLNEIRNEIDDMVSALKTYLIAKGAPVIIGEWGTSNVDKAETDYDARRSHMFSFVEYFVQKTKENGIGTFYWMGLSNGTNRSVPVFNQADLAEAIVKAYYGNTDGYKFPTRDDLGTTIYEVTFNSLWSELNLTNGNVSTSTNKGIELELEEEPAPGAFQFKVYDTGKTIPITAATSTLTFTSDMGATISRVTLQSRQAGNEAVVKNVYLIKSDGTKQKMEVSAFWGCSVTEKIITGIRQLTQIPTIGNPRVYNLKGQQVINPQHGIFIQNGRKFVAK